MERECFKYLPDGSKSYLSLNDYIIRINDSSFENEIPGIEMFDGIAGSEVYAYRQLAEEVGKVFPAFYDEEEHNIAGFLNEKLNESGECRNQAEEILDHLGKGFAAMIFSLKEGTAGRIDNELTEDDWKFWKSCSHIFFVGRVSEGITGTILEEKVRLYLGRMAKLRKTTWEEPDIRFCFHDTVKTISLMGCTRSPGIGGECVYVFDFGNTAIKRGRAVRKDGTYELTELTNRLHRDFSGMPDTKETAECIHNVILRTIIETMGEFVEMSDSCEVSLCIANNCLDGNISDRGYYRSLRLLSESYRDYLEQELAAKCGNEVKVCITNDAQAVANLFGKYSPNAAVVTLGTRMGIAYP